MRRLLILALLMATMPAPASAHSGALNAEGCHTNRKTGDYHCHGSTERVAPQQARSSAPSRAWRNCTEARAAGAAPVYRGQPGYGPHLDRDGDGIGCEPYRRR